MANILQRRFSLAAPVPFGTITPDRFFSDAMTLASTFDNDIETVICGLIGETAMEYLGIADENIEVVLSDACPKDKVIHPYKVMLEIC